MKFDCPAEEYLKEVLLPKSADCCPVRQTLELLCSKWRWPVIYELCKKTTCRFGELKNVLPSITNTMLSATLRDLEALGMVQRKQYNEIPPRVEYSLTAKGRALIPTFCEMAKWGENYLLKK